MEEFKILGYMFIFSVTRVFFFYENRVLDQVNHLFPVPHLSQDEEGKGWFIECLLPYRLGESFPQILFMVPAHYIEHIFTCEITIYQDPDIGILVIKLLRMQQKTNQVKYLFSETCHFNANIKAMISKEAMKVCSEKVQPFI